VFIRADVFLGVIVFFIDSTTRDIFNHQQALLSIFFDTLNIQNCSKSKILYIFNTQLKNTHECKYSEVKRELTERVY
jgi:hypothetical protein